MINIKPYITEKTVLLAKSGKFTLLVSDKMCKPEILQNIKYLFKVNPSEARILNKKKVVSKTAKGVWRTKRGYKKVIVSLPSPEVILGFETFLQTKDEKTKKKITEKSPKVKQ